MLGRLLISRHARVRSSAAVALSAAALILAITGCSTTAPASPATPTASHTAAPTPLMEQVDSIALTCAVLGAWQTSLQDTEVAESLGETDAAGYAAVVNTTANTFVSLRRNPQAGLQTQVWALQEAMKTSPPTVPGATFDPHSEDFTAAVNDAEVACVRNGSPMTVYALPGQG
jgi:hypothetical protein